MGKLEGPKKHHDDHGPHASVPGKKSIPKEHWEMSYNTNEASKLMNKMGGGNFMPKNPSTRSTTHVKINKEDH